MVPDRATQAAFATIQFRKSSSRAAYVDDLCASVTPAGRTRCTGVLTSTSSQRVLPLTIAPPEGRGQPFSRPSHRGPLCLETQSLAERTITRASHQPQCRLRRAESVYTCG